uniref:Ig-like domain-containing protein n=1 Tax=Podarcis muralis TaxID=64176 RepID=A0A670JUN0_PODMU
MAWSFLVLLLFLTYPSGSSSQPALTQRPSASFSSGETVHLSCTLNAGYSISSYRVEWYQQISGGAPRFRHPRPYYKPSDQGRGTGVPERFSVSPDSSSNLWNLVITGAQAEDDADYYCNTWDGSSKMFHSAARIPGLEETYWAASLTSFW